MTAPPAAGGSESLSLRLRSTSGSGREAPVHERLVAESLAKRCNGRVVLLHDRRVPGSRANVDHIAVTPSGVWVIDAKRHKGKVEVTAPLFGRPKLRIKGRDCSVLVTGVANQVELVSAALAAAPGVSVQGCMCFVEAELPLPLLGRPRIGGVVLHHRRSLARALNKNGPLSDRTIAELTEELLERFPSA